MASLYFLKGTTKDSNFTYKLKKKATHILRKYLLNVYNVQHVRGCVGCMDILGTTPTFKELTE